MRVLAAVLMCSLVVSLAFLDLSGASAAPFDFDVPGGHFFKQANGLGGAGNTGYAVVDDVSAPFWSEFKRLGGVPAAGYPVSRRFDWDGFLVQAFQKVVFQWRPEAGQVYFVNVLDRMSAAGKDGWLEAVRSTPPAFDNSGDRGLAWDDVVMRHQAILDASPGIRKVYFSDNDPIPHFGLPVAYRDYGNVLVVRAQRAVFQQWKDDVPWARAGEIVVANGGDIAKEAGMYPPEAINPEASPQAVATPQPATRQQPGTWRVLIQGDLPPGYSGELTPGRLSVPNDLTVDLSGNLYVTDLVCGCVQKYAPGGELLAQWSPSTGAGEHSLLGGVAVDQDGNLYASDGLHQRVLKFSPTGQVLTQWKTEEPAGIALDPQGNVIVAGGDRITRFSPTGQLISQWTSSGPRQLTWAQHLAVDGSGNMYVSEGHWPGSNGIAGYVATILKLSPDGEVLAQWGGWGFATGQFENPQGIAVDRDDNIYVADWGNNRVQRLSPSGQSTVMIGGPTDGPVQMRPQSVAVDTAGNLYLLDASNHQILKMVR